MIVDIDTLKYHHLYEDSSTFRFPGRLQVRRSRICYPN